MKKTRYFDHIDLRVKDVERAKEFYVSELWPKGRKMEVIDFRPAVVGRVAPRGASWGVEPISRP